MRVGISPELICLFSKGSFKEADRAVLALQAHAGGSGAASPRLTASKKSD